MAGDARPVTLRRVVIACAVGAVVAAAAVALALSVGATSVHWADFFAGDELTRTKVLVYRLPRAIAALIVGGALAVGGVVFQALIRNPLASPYVLGVSAGGSLGAVLAAAAGAAWLAPGAFVGCLVAIGVIVLTAHERGRFPASTLLLAGVVINALFSAGIAFVNLLAGADARDRMLQWLVGGLPSDLSWPMLAGAAAAVVAVAGVLFVIAPAMNVVSISDILARRVGVPVRGTRAVLLLTGSALTAIAVSIAGPIGFVGLLVPHALRLMIGPDHRLLLPVSMFAGGAFLVVVDVAAQSVWRAPLPAGVLTALLGGPVFLALLNRRDRGRAGLDG